MLDEYAVKNFERALGEGLYADNLKRYMKLFPKRQVLILIYDDIEKNQTKFIQNIYQFLEVDSSFIPPSSKARVNVTGINTVRSKALHRITTKLHHFVSKGLARKLLLPILNILGLGNLYKFIRRLNWNKSETVIPIEKSVHPHVREQLFRYYKDDIEETGRILNRDLSHWRQQVEL